MTVRIDLDGDTSALMLPLRDVSEFSRKLFAGPRTRREGREHSSPGGSLWQAQTRPQQDVLSYRQRSSLRFASGLNGGKHQFLGDGDDLAHPEIDSTRSVFGALSSGSYNLGRHAGYIPARSRELAGKRSHCARHAPLSRQMRLPGAVPPTRHRAFSNEVRSDFILQRSARIRPLRRCGKCIVLKTELEFSRLQVVRGWCYSESRSKMRIPRAFR